MTLCFGEKVRKPRATDWSQEEMEELRQLVKSGLSRAEVARALGRSRDTVNHKSQAMNIRWADEGKRRWTNEEIIQLRHGAWKGMTVAEVAKEINRTFRATSAKAFELKISFTKHGENHYKCKLTKAQIQEIWQLREKGATYREIADGFGVDRSLVGHILNLRGRFRESLEVLMSKAA